MGRKRERKRTETERERVRERARARAKEKAKMDMWTRWTGKEQKRYSNGQGDRDGGQLAVVGSMVEDGRVLHCPLTCC